ncbi:hypothetical protein E4Z66_08885 [Aliishimia ponticola]|uniref:DUF423 domain-containing protein n=1 Tax=Aliishimia ponticola TaxID=2499833 RepID=A0A4S4NC99_9RHOB|nr:hypothetical protein [Aliishimia ponticola]THH37044.1 hypothetical protein E4Z66_08885 [Aliishimia ponticola]
MRNAALTMGIIGGLIAMVIGFFGYGYTQVAERHAEVGELFGQFDNVQLVRVASFIAPLLALAGGGMAKVRALWGGILLIAAGALMYLAYGFSAFTMFPIGLCVLGGIFALAAGKPDEPKAHF